MEYAYDKHLEDLDCLPVSKPKQYCPNCGNEITDDNKQIGNECLTCTIRL